MSESPTLENSVQQVNQINILSHDDKGVTIRNVENLNMKARKRGRNIPKGTDPKIYVNDGSFGSNLHYVKGQRAYALKNEKPSPVSYKHCAESVSAPQLCAMLVMCHFTH